MSILGGKGLINEGFPPFFNPSMTEVKRERELDGILMVKAEFKRLRTEPEDSQPTSETNRSDNKKKRGQNKGKERRVKKSFDKVNLCLAVAQGLECTSDYCKEKKEHDLSIFMASREPDLGDQCYYFNIYGFCRFGIKCRYAGAHTVDGKQVRKTVVRSESDFIKNTLPLDFAKKLRTEFKPARSNEFIKWWESVGKFGDADTFPFSVTKGNVEKNDPNNNMNETEKPSSKINLAGQKLDATNQVNENTDPLDVEEESKNDKETEPQLVNDKKNNINESDNSISKINEVNSAPFDGPERLPNREKKRIDFRGKSYLAPLTTVGNLPFRRICKEYGVDITCGEMALTDNLKKGASQEWALTRRHASEDIFGIQVTGSWVGDFSICCEMIQENLEIGKS